ncbi:hypothetical protein GKE82_24010 [Conexibacter sp. W3-3-2]|uniref:hypothetical protein n=1 Tax=Conexibacter sp. W3-3-2 TaxID=2675227 RepID=UPI0012B9B4C4|nr:hypothetical protein [Conexibacter sp. W3-3-2]MTD47273.1 hypothetical protein [Conexibacter sp. W3-3-2]
MLGEAATLEDLRAAQRRVAELEAALERAQAARDLLLVRVIRERVGVDVGQVARAGGVSLRYTRELLRRAA